MEAGIDAGLYRLRLIRFPAVASPPVSVAPAGAAHLARSPEALRARADEILPWLIAIRRDLHRHPELGLEEHRTAARVQAHLDELGIAHRDGIAETGVLGLLPGDPEGPVVALRGDMDALPLEDQKDVPYRSQVPGKMHACGHDVHTTIVLGAARLLSEIGELPGLVKLIFQPAEETVGGARLLVAEGVLEDPKVEAIFGLHVDPELPVGTIAVKYGQRNAASDDLEIDVVGESAHAAYPDKGVDAIVAAAHVVMAIQTVVSRNVDAREAAVVTLGTIEGGRAHNVIPGRVRLVGTIRTLDPAVRAHVRQRVREAAEGAAAALGARAEVTLRASFDPVINDDKMIDRVRDSGTRLLGGERVRVLTQPSMGVEDFGFYLGSTPGAFYSLGVGNVERGIVHPVHHQAFDVDERCLAIGAAMQALNALATLERRPTTAA